MIISYDPMISRIISNEWFICLEVVIELRCFSDVIGAHNILPISNTLLTLVSLELSGSIYLRETHFKLFYMLSEFTWVFYWSSVCTLQSFDAFIDNCSILIHCFSFLQIC
jgi:hypothetical protein